MGAIVLPFDPVGMFALQAEATSSFAGLISCLESPPAQARGRFFVRVGS